MSPVPHDRSGASLGKSKISVFEIFVVRFGLHLAVFGVCTLAATSDFLRIYLKISIFDFTQTGNGPGGHRVPQVPSPVGL